MLTNLEKTPWPFYGGKQDAAPVIWEALGDPEHYAEPFMGSMAVLLRRPHVANRTYHSETVNDLDGLLVNAWRALQWSPDATAEAASWPVSEADTMARHLAILAWQKAGNVERLMADVRFHDPVIAGYWVWGCSNWIGTGWCSGDGPWIVGADGRITKRAKGEAGARRKLPQVSDNGRGVNHAGTREPGVARQLPHVSNNGQGVNHAGTREPGVARQLPHVSDDGDEPEFHPMTMPEVRRWFGFLSARLRHVRILNGDWKRCATSGVLKPITVRQGGKCGVLLDPPYRVEGTRADNIYTHDDGDKVSAEVRAWCIENGGDPDYRIALCGYADEGHAELEALGWRVVEWYKGGFLKGGMANQSAEGTKQKSERIWLSPHCLGAKPKAQGSLW